MKILQLSPQFPFPADDGGKIGISNIFCEFVKQKQEVTLFALNCEKYLPSGAIEEAKKYGNVEIFQCNTKNTLPKIAKSIVTNQAIFLQKHWNKNIIYAVEKIISSCKPDVLQAEHTSMAPIALYFKKKYGIPVGLRLHNIEHNIWEKYVNKLQNPLSRSYIKHQANLLKKQELNIISKVDVNFAISDNEHKILSEMLPNANIITAPAGIVPEKWQPSNFSERNKKQLILATNFNWVHNAEALRWFLKEVLPLVHLKEPKIKMLILGKNPPNWIKNFEKIGAISVGYVLDIQEFMRQSNIYVAPLFVGAGIRIKILEAMAMAMPVVATSISADGINASKTDGLFISDTAENYAESILYLIANDEKCALAGQNAKSYVLDNFSLEVSITKMIAEYRKIV